MTNEDSPAVKVGQIWADNDSRVVGRTLRVDTVDGGFAWCTVLTNGTATQDGLDQGSPWVRDRRGKTTRIAIQRMKLTRTGYRLVQDVPGE